MGRKATTAGWAERVEWVLGIAAGLLVCGLAGYLVVEGSSSGRAPPALSVTVEPAEPGEVRFTVRNDGGHAATAVALSLSADGQQRRLVIDYLPSHSQATGRFVLGESVSLDDATVAVDGYLDP